MGSPILGSSFNPILWTGSACAQFRELFATNEKLNQIFSWMFNIAGELSDAVVDGIADRIAPCGVIHAYGGSVMPSDYWLPCNGQAVSRDAYPKLFARYGTAFGAGDGTTTFNLPNPRNRALVGSGDEYAIAETFGVKEVVLADADVPKHYHGVGKYSRSSSNDITFVGRSWSLADTGATASVFLTGDDPSDMVSAINEGDVSTTVGIPNIESPITTAAHENRQPSLAVNFIIKVK